MKKAIHRITDFVTTKKGMWITLTIWVLLAVLLSAGPKAADYRSANFQSLPDDAPSIQAEKELKAAFPDAQATPGILVFSGDAPLETTEILLS
ncbi:hypothetical protein [Tetzosporium hominis]|uniref:hypothetical protein n=1 Tax=Tetzosporium hominis TaxID=2020506 RepID=UPI0026AF3ECD